MLSAGELLIAAGVDDRLLELVGVAVLLEALLLLLLLNVQRLVVAVMGIAIDDRPGAGGLRVVAIASGRGGGRYEAGLLNQGSQFIRWLAGLGQLVAVRVLRDVLQFRILVLDGGGQLTLEHVLGQRRRC